MGEPVCWMDMLCPFCGLLIERREAVSCPHCGAQRPEPDAGRPEPDIGEAPRMTPAG
jgi:hypothetical protein